MDMFRVPGIESLNYVSTRLICHILLFTIYMYVAISF